MFLLKTLFHFERIRGNDNFALSLNAQRSAGVSFWLTNYYIRLADYGYAEKTSLFKINYIPLITRMTNLKTVLSVHSICSQGLNY